MKYRKKPVVVEAFQMTRENMDSNANWPNWIHDAWRKDRYETGSLWADKDPSSKKQIYQCGTLEGVYYITEDDFLIQGVKGEIYPCKPDIFEMTYEKVRYGGAVGQ